jgi:hypothetical protein
MAASTDTIYFPLSSHLALCNISFTGPIPGSQLNLAADALGVSPRTQIRMHTCMERVGSTALRPVRHLTHREQHGCIKSVTGAAEVTSSSFSTDML